MQKINPEVLHLLDSMAHNKIENYAIPGLTSALLGDRHKDGTVRLLTSERMHDENIIPHSHRHDFACLVLQGWVKNIVWTPTEDTDAEYYHHTRLEYDGAPGSYTVDREFQPAMRMEADCTLYQAGEWYSMTHDQIHSIKFSRDAMVLFFAGYNKTDATVTLEPVANGCVVPTFKVESWMFQKGSV